MACGGLLGPQILIPHGRVLFSHAGAVNASQPSWLSYPRAQPCRRPHGRTTPPPQLHSPPGLPRCTTPTPAAPPPQLHPHPSCTTSRAAPASRSQPTPRLRGRMESPRVPQGQNVPVPCATRTLEAFPCAARPECSGPVCPWAKTIPAPCAARPERSGPVSPGATTGPEAAGVWLAKRGCCARCDR
jgi:hypothetical protein